MTLRAKLTALFAVFAAVPVVAATWPVSRALSAALEAEYAARLDQAARGVEGEVRRLGDEAVEAARDVARSPELEALARDRARADLDPGEVAARAAAWMQARGLDVLAVTGEDGVVVASGHLPGRAGDPDPDLDLLAREVPPGRAAPREVARATPDGVEPALVAIAWVPAPDADPALRVFAGLALGPRFAQRLAALTGGDVEVRPAGRARAAEARPGGDGGRDLAARLVGATRARTREVPVPGARGPAATIAMTLPASGLARAQVTAAVALLAALLGCVAAAALGGSLLARRITRPVEALAAGARRVARGDLGARVDAPASGEVGELVRAFNAMTADLARTTVRAAAAERVAAWREVARHLAHEVKNPLTPVAMSVETLRDAWSRRHPEFPAIFEEGTRAIGEEVRRLKRVVDEFGRFARLPAPEPRPFDPAELLRSALAIYPEGQGEIRVERDVEAGLPAVTADPDQVSQVLHNLVKNALEAVSARGRGRVRVSARREGPELCVEVSDDGPGIAPEHLARVFDPDFTTKPSGTGLGLAIARRIATEHGGRLDVASAPGAGTTFTLRLPLEPPPAAISGWGSP